MITFLRFLVSYALSLVALYICGFPNVVNHLSESLAVTTFFTTALLPAALGVCLWHQHTKLTRLTQRLKRLEDALHLPHEEEEEEEEEEDTPDSD